MSKSITQTHLESSRSHMRHLEISYAPQVIHVTQLDSPRARFTIAMSGGIISFISSSNPVAAFGHYSRSTLEPPHHLLGALRWVADMAHNWGYAAEKYHAGTGHRLPQDDAAARDELLEHWVADLNDSLLECNGEHLSLDDILDRHDNVFTARLECAMAYLEKHGDKFIQRSIERWRESWPCETAQDCDHLFYELFDDPHTHGSYLPYPMTDAIALAEALVAVERDLDAKGQAVVAGLKVKTAEGAVVEVEMSEGVVAWVDTTPIQLDALSQQVSAVDAQIADLAQRWDTQPLVGLLQCRYMREVDFTQNVKSLAERVHLMEADGNLIGLREELKALQRSIDAQLNALGQDDYSTIEALVQQQEQATAAKVQEAINTPPTTFTIDLTEDELAMFQAKQREVDDLKVKLAQVEVVNKNLIRERDELVAKLHLREVSVPVRWITEPKAQIEDLRVKLAQVEVVNKNLIRERDELAAKLQALQDEATAEVEVEIVSNSQRTLDALRHAAQVIKDYPPTEDAPRPNIRITSELHRILGGVGLHSYHIQINPPMLDDQIEQTVKHMHHLDRLLGTTLQEMWLKSTPRLHLGEALIVRDTEHNVVLAVPSRWR
jgi:hypothetical protein